MYILTSIDAIICEIEYGRLERRLRRQGRASWFARLAKFIW